MMGRIASAGRQFMRYRRLTALLVFAAGLTAPAAAQGLSLEQVGGFDAPTYVTSDPADADRLFVVEREGRIKLVENGSASTFLDIDPLVLTPDEGAGNGEGGLFSLAFAPDYATSHLFYVVYRGADDPDIPGSGEVGDWHLDEFRAEGDVADPASRREVLTIHYPGDRLDLQFHYGGQLQFGADGYLYVSVGDGGPQGDPLGNSQNLGNLLGTILRIDPAGSGPGDYTVPADNPFAATAGCADGCDEIWSYGLRNPWRFSFDREGGALVIADVGHDTWEEVDYEPVSLGLGRGKNFGWNCREGAHDYPGPGTPAPVCADLAGAFTDPVFEFQHAEGAECASITGGYVVRDVSLTGLYGRYLYTDLCNGDLRSILPGLPTATGDRSEGLAVPLVTSFGEDADCRIYVASFTDFVYRLVEPGSTTTPGCPRRPQEPSLPDGPQATRPPASGPPGLELRLKARSQALGGPLRLFATANSAATLIARGKAIKRRKVELAKNRWTLVTLRLRPAIRRHLLRVLERRGSASVAVNATATDGSRSTVTHRVKVELVDCHPHACIGPAVSLADRG